MFRQSFRDLESGMPHGSCMEWLTRMLSTFFVSTCLIMSSSLQGVENLPAFPGAEGFGALASGGRGGEIYHVTNLRNDGRGSLRDAVSRGPRIVVFDIGGYIELASPLQVAGNITVAGQTAPGEGICVRNYEVSLSKAHNVIIRYLRFRQGMTPTQKRKYALAVNESSDVILDHLSIEWGRWDCIGVGKSSNVSIQYCLIGEAIDPQRFGCLCQSDNVTFFHNLWIDNQSRNPKAKGHVQYINNVVYNWGADGYVGGHSKAPHTADLIGNYFIGGPSSSTRFAGEFTSTDRIFQSGNLVEMNRDGHLFGRPAVSKDFAGATLITRRSMFPSVGVTEESAANAYADVSASAGDSIHRDTIDRRLIDQLNSLGRIGAIIHDPKQVGGFAEIHGGSARAIPAADERTILPSGYTSTELFLNSLVNVSGVQR